MKKGILYLLVLSLAFSLTACGKGGNNEVGKALTYIIRENAALPKSVTGVSRLLIHDGKAYLCCQEGNGETGDTLSYLATVNLDGTDFKKLPLSADESCAFRDFVFASNGSIWTVCETNTSFSLMQFDSGGKVLQTVDLSSVLDKKITVNSYTQLFLNLDTGGNLCLTVKDIETYASIFDSKGQFLFSLNDKGNPMTVITTAEGKIAVCSSTDGGGSYNLLTIDIANHGWEKPSMALGPVKGIYAGKNACSFYLYDSSNFYSYHAATGEKELLFNWSNLGLSTGDTHVCELPDGRFAVLSAGFSQTNLHSYELSIVEKGVDDRTVLSMMSLQPADPLLQAIAQFNRSGSKYKVELTSYFPFYQNVSEDDWEKAVQKFNVELISGKVPDIVDLNHMPVEAYYSKGVLENLDPYLKDDPDIKKEDYFENILDAMRVNGGLPYVTDSVAIQTVFADSRVVGTSPGWTQEAFSSLLDQYGPSAFGNVKREFILRTIARSGNRFVDWPHRTCHFDSPEFTKLLEMAQKFGSGGASSDDNVVAQFNGAGSCYDIARYNDFYDGNLNAIGYPNDSGVYHVIAPSEKIGISSAGKHKEGAWAFVRTFLQEKQQDASYFFPMRKASFEKVAAEAMTGNSVWSNVSTGIVTGRNIESKVTKQDVEIARQLLSSAKYCASDDDTITGIVLDEAKGYFSGEKTTQTVAANVQNRVQLYINERS